MEKKNELTRYELQSMQRIKQLIQEFCDGSQQRFSEKTGVNKGSISQYLNSKNSPSESTAKKIAATFNISPAWVMGYDVSRSSITQFENNSKDDETILIDNFRELTTEGKQKAIEYIRDLNQNMKYSAKLQKEQSSFSDGKEITDYYEAIAFLNQTNSPIVASSNSNFSKEDIIMIANEIKKHQRI